MLCSMVSEITPRFVRDADACQMQPGQASITLYPSTTYTPAAQLHLLLPGDNARANHSVLTRLCCTVLPKPGSSGPPLCSDFTRSDALLTSQMVPVPNLICAICPNVECFLYVDDFLICYRSKHIHIIERHLQRCLNKIQYWLIPMDFVSQLPKQFVFISVVY